MAAAFLAATPGLSLAGGAAAPPARGGDPLVVPKRVRQGDLLLLRVAPGAEPPAEVGFSGRGYPAVLLPQDGGRGFLIGVDLEAPPGRGEIVVRRAGGKEERRRIEIARRPFPEERLTLPPALVTPPPELEERVARERELAAEVYRTSAAAQLWEGAFRPPLALPGSGNFGRRRILNGIPKAAHAGEDFTAPAGTPVRAIARGRVRLCRDFYYSGLTVLIDHGAGLVSQYLHLERILVEEGSTVAPGQEIGRVGSTGRATGPHLHFGLRLFEQRVDPASLFALLGSGAAAR